MFTKKYTRQIGVFYTIVINYLYISTKIYLEDFLTIIKIFYPFSLKAAEQRAAAASEEAIQVF